MTNQKFNYAQLMKEHHAQQKEESNGMLFMANVGNNSFVTEN